MNYIVRKNSSQGVSVLTFLIVIGVTYLTSESSSNPTEEHPKVKKIKPEKNKRKAGLEYDIININTARKTR